jgi:glycosyltransferase involved in cell wall biosynthesis
MKIFLVCNSLGGGGAERVHVNLANGFAQRGHEVYLVADTNMEASYPVDETVKVLPLCPKSDNKFVKWGKAIGWLRKNIKQYRPDVVIGNMDLCSLISRLASLGLSVPVIFTNHHALESQAYDVHFTTKVCDFVIPWFMSATTLLTIADQEYMARKYHQKKNIFVMPNPLTFTPVSSIPPKENIIFAAGRLNNWRYKGWDILISAAERLAPLLREEKWKIQIAGGGTKPETEVIEKMINNAHVEDVVELLGYRTDMESLYQRSAIYCLSSRSEGLPMVLIEAMSQGCAPVACENLGRTKEIVTNESEGLLFKTGDVDDLAKQLSIMITDCDKRTKIQNSAVKRSEFYLIENIVDMWEDLLKNVVKNK